MSTFRPARKQGAIRCSPQVLIVDDHALVRESLRFVFAVAGIDRVWEATECKEAVGVTRANRIDVVLLDTNVDEQDGIDLLRKIKATDPAVAILVHSFHDSPRLLSRSFHAGAAGYLIKGEDKNSLIHAVRQAVAGEKVWTTEQMGEIRQADAEAGDCSYHTMASLGPNTDQAC